MPEPVLQPEVITTPLPPRDIPEFQPLESQIPRAPAPAIVEPMHPDNAEEIALVVSNGMGDSALFDILRDEFTAFGRSPEWEAFQGRFLASQNKKTKQRILRRAADRLATLQQLGIPYDPKVLVKDIQDDEGRRTETRGVSPEYVAFATELLQASDPNNTNIAKDFRERAGDFTPEDYVAAVKQIQSIHFRERDDLLEEFGDLSVGGQIRDFMQWLLPQEFFQQPSLRAIFDTDLGFGKEILWGEFIVAIREQVTRMQPEERLSSMRKVISFFREHPILINPGRVTQFLRDVYTDEAILGLPEDEQASQLMRYIFDAVSIMDATIIAGGLRSGFRLLAGGKRPSIALANRLNREFTQQQLGKELLQRDIRNILAGGAPRREAVAGVRVEIALSQLPKPGLRVGKGLSAVENLPDEIIAEGLRLDTILETIKPIVDKTRRLNYTPAEVEHASVRVAKEMEQAAAPTVRSGRTSIELHEDGGGIRIGLVLGEDAKYGFRSPEHALDRALDIDPTLRSIEILRVNPETQVLEKHLTITELAEQSLTAVQTGKFPGASATRALAKTNEEIIRLRRLLKADRLSAKKKVELEGLLKTQLRRAQQSQSRLGKVIGPDEYYIRQTQDHFMTSIDKQVFGEDVVIHGGMLNRFLLTPSAQFSAELVGPWMKLFGAENALISIMQKMVRPLAKLRHKSRTVVNEMWEWTETFGKQNKRTATFDELRGAFPEARIEEYSGWYTMKRFHDAIYEIQNGRLLRDLTNRNFKTVQYAGGEVHGIQLTEEQAIRELAGRARGSGRQALELTTQTGVAFTRSEIEAMYRRGAGFVRTDLRISAKNGSEFTVVIHDPLIGSKIGPLSQRPLDFIPGYYPRMYKEQFFIRRVNKGGALNGVARTTRNTVMVVPNQRAGDKMIARLIEKEKSPDITYEVLNKTNLSTRDRVQRDLEYLQTEGRLFFDKRNTEGLRDLTGNLAQVNSPIDTLFSTVNQVARQLTTEDLVKTLKTSFKKLYDGKLGFKIDFEKTDSSAVLAGKLRTASKELKSASERDLANKAVALWDYIRLVEGSIAEGGRVFRRAVTNLAERVDEFFSGVPGLRKVMPLVYRNISHASPVEGAKRLAFFDFLVTRPFRQVWLQGSQHLFIAPLDPKYVLSGGLWRDSTISLQSIISTNMKLGSGKLADDMFTRNARLMGLEVDEFKILIKNLNESGIIQKVDVHSFTGGFNRRGFEEPVTAVGRGVEAIKKPFVGAGRLLRKVGFDLGEQFNVTASWNMALRLEMKKSGQTSVRQLTKEQWDKVNERGAGFALAMDRTNSAKFQYGLLSLPLQFFSFSHKVLLSMLRGGIPLPLGPARRLPGIRQVDVAISNIGNRAFTPIEARRLIAGQFVMFGMAGFGLKDPARTLLADLGLDKYLNTEVQDIIEGGLVDYALDASVSWITGTEKDYAFDEFMAPGANLVYIAADIVDAIFEDPIGEHLAGASGSTVGRIWNAFNMASILMAVEEFPLEKKLALSAEYIASGAMSGYSDYFKARVALANGHWISQRGMPTEQKVDFTDALMKGLFGINDQGLLDTFKVDQDNKAHEEQLNRIAEEYYRQARFTSVVWHKGEISEKTARDRFILQSAAMAAVDDDERAAIFFKFAQFNAADVEQGLPSLGTLIDQAYGPHTNLPPREELFRLIESTNAISAEDKRLLIDSLREKLEALPQAGDDLEQLNLRALEELE